MVKSFKSFKSFIEETQLDEALITFARERYPAFGHAVILAGGAGSGKGFVLDKLLGIEGKVFDVDQLKGMAMRAPGIIARVKKEHDGLDLSKLNLRDPDDVFTLHSVVGDSEAAGGLDLPNKKEAAFTAAVALAAPDKKPNIIFDVTLKDINKVQKISKLVTKLGYAKEKIHIVWVVNDIKIAMKQNKERSRVVPEDILINTHRGVNNTINDLITQGSLRTYMDGDLFFAFNNANVDTFWAKGEGKKSGAFMRQDDAGKAITAKDKKQRKAVSRGADYVQVKKSGEAVNTAALTKEVKRKLNHYTPRNVEW
jgi:hypothetical protein